MNKSLISIPGCEPLNCLMSRQRATFPAITSRTSSRVKTRSPRNDFFFHCPTSSFLSCCKVLLLTVPLTLRRLEMDLDAVSERVLAFPVKLS